MKLVSFAKLLGMSLVGLLLLSGCANQKSVRVSEQKVDLIEEVSNASIALLNSSSAAIARNRTILATSFADIDDLQQSSTFGRMIGDAMAGELVGHGYKVVEVRLRDNLFTQPRTGEFMLSRELRNISQEHDAQAVLVGTYAVGGEYVYANARLVNVLDSRVISSHDFRLPLNRDIRKMLSQKRR